MKRDRTAYTVERDPEELRRRIDILVAGIAHEKRAAALRAAALRFLLGDEGERDERR